MYIYVYILAIFSIIDFDGSRFFASKKSSRCAWKSEQYIAQNPSINYLSFINAKSIVFLFLFLFPPGNIFPAAKWRRNLRIIDNGLGRYFQVRSTMQLLHSEEWPGPLQTFYMESFATVINAWKPLIIFAKLSLLDACRPPLKPVNFCYKALLATPLIFIGCHTIRAKNKQNGKIINDWGYFFMQ